LSRAAAAAGTFAVQLAAVAVGVALSALVLAAIGQSPGHDLSTLFRGAFGTRVALEQTTLKAIPLALTGLAVTLPLRLRLWNIGAEGQYYLGAIASSWVALHFGGWPQWALLAAMALAGALGGGAWALVAAIPRALWGVNEIITTLLLNYVAIQLLAYLVNGPLRGKQTFGFPSSDPFPDASRLPAVGHSQVHVGVFFPLVAALLLLGALHRSQWGFRVRMIGASPVAARVVGMSAARNIVVVLGLGGALAGLAGMVEVSVTFGQLQQGISPGYGYMAIVIAALAGASLLGTLVVAFLFGGFIVGGLALQVLGVPQAFVLMLEGIILFCALAGARLAGLRIPRRAQGRPLQTALEETPSTP
jgi:general nucleoside transport system permease protein